MAANDLYKLPRLYVAADITPGAPLVLDQPQTHYLKNVLRKKEGDELRLFNGRHGEYLATIEKLGKKEAITRIGTIIMPQPPAAPRIHLIFAPIKKARLDMLIEKAVELGATDLHLIMTERTENRNLNIERLEAQIIEALEQCERQEKPILHAPEKLDNFLVKWQGGPILMCIEREEAPHITACLDDSLNEAAVLIGPEGGFSPKEIEKTLGIKACRPVSLGSAVLRAETAVFHALSLISANFCKNSGGTAKIG